MTKKEGFFKDMWNDPVWSKVISAAVIGAALFIAHIISPNIGDKIKDILLKSTSTPNWVYASLSVALIAWTCLLIVRCNRKSTKSGNLTSASWFAEIVHQIADCRSARIYLRGFAHPDQFRTDHRDALLKFMRLLKKRIEAGADIQIAAYHYRTDEKSGLDWLKTELGENFDGLSRITLIKNQPVSNSSSMYLFDSGVLLYNERNNGSRLYHSRNLSGTVVHHLLEKGYVAVRSTFQ